MLREEASEAKALTSSGKNEARRTSITPTKTPPTPNLTTHSGSGPGSCSPPGAENQGPSPVNLSVELEVEFPEEMVTEMKNNAAKKRDEW